MSLYCAIETRFPVEKVGENITYGQDELDITPIIDNLGSGFPEQAYRLVH